MSNACPTLKTATSAEPPKTHVMVFDKPFLVMLQRRGAQAPYFALWADNADVLVKAWRN